MGHVAAVTVQTVHHRMRRSRISARVFEMQQSIASVILFEKKNVTLGEVEKNPTNGMKNLNKRPATKAATTMMISIIPKDVIKL